MSLGLLVFFLGTLSLLAFFLVSQRSPTLAAGLGFDSSYVDFRSG